MAKEDTKRARVRVSKNRKKNWNKVCRIEDVEEFLEEKRTEERLGGLLSEKPAEELYFISTDESKEEPKKRQRGVLRCHQGLQSNSSVPPPVKPLKGEGKKPEETIPRAMKKKILKSIAKSPKTENKRTPEFHDLWAEDASKPVDPDIADLIFHRDEYLKKRPVKVPCYRYQKPSLLPPVEVPHPGASYNPTYSDHQELLKEAVQVEEKKLKEELHLKRVLTDMFPKQPEAPSAKTWMQEMSQGLFDEEEKKNEEDAEDDSMVLSVNPPVTTENRKSRSQKRKKLERIEQERERLKAKKMKKEMNEVYRIRSIAKEIKKAEKITEERVLKRVKRKVEKMFQPRTIGPHKYEPNDLEVNLTEELRGSLRSLKVEGNILEDRYKSLQRRNIIEPRVRQKRKRKYKLKVQVKRGHRNFK